MRTLADFQTIGELPHAVVLVGDREEGEREVLTFLRRMLGSAVLPADFFSRSVPLWTVEDSKDLHEALSRRATSDHKIALIAASQFSDRAQDPLLKLLEEPSGRTTIFILVDRAEVLLPTIRSRVLVLSVAGSGQLRNEVHVKAKTFLAAPVTKRLQLIEPLTKSIEGDSDRAKDEKRHQKDEARLLLQELARLLAQERQPRKGTDVLLRMGALLQSPAPNLRLILEHLAFSLQAK